MKRGTIILIIIIILIVAGLAIYFSAKPKGKYKLGYVGISKANNEFVPHLLDRPPKGSINAGDTITIKNAGKYNMKFTARAVWIDKNNNVGAVYSNRKDITIENPTSTISWGKIDSTYSGIGEVIVT